MNRMRLAASGYAEILDSGNTRELNIKYFNAPLEPSLADDCRKILGYLAGTNVVPGCVRKGGPYLPDTSILDGVMKLCYFKQRPPDVMDFPSHYRIESYCVAVLGSRGEADEMVRPRGYVLMENLVYVERDTPMKAWAQFSLEIPEPAEDAAFEREQHDERNQRLEDRLDDLENSVKHDRFLLEGKF